MYKSGGFNVYPREIEIVLENHPNIVAAAIIGVDDAQWGQVGYAFIELSEDMSFDEIKQWCRDQIADYKVPKHFKRLDTMPRTTVDKIDRVQLAQMASAH
jgi:acyl-CoA synthetase (AMP-forming)/AMP-acid ligase II